MLSAERLLAHASVDPDGCRFVGDVATHLQERLPVAAPLQQWFESSSTGQGIWLMLQLDEETLVLKRRVLFTPAGLGLCKQADA